MKKMMMTVMSCLLLGVLFSGGCDTVNSTERENPTAIKQMVADKRIVSDSYLNDHARVVGVNQGSTVDGFLKVQVEIKNPSLSACNFRYTFEWFDEQGMLISSTTPSWFAKRILGGESMFLSDVAPTTMAKDFRLKLIKE